MAIVKLVRIRWFYGYSLNYRFWVVFLDLLIERGLLSQRNFCLVLFRTAVPQCTIPCCFSARIQFITNHIASSFAFRLDISKNIPLNNCRMSICKEIAFCNGYITFTISLCKPLITSLNAITKVSCGSETPIFACYKCGLICIFWTTPRIPSLVLRKNALGVVEMLTEYFLLCLSRGKALSLFSRKYRLPKPCLSRTIQPSYGSALCDRMEYRRKLFEWRPSQNNVSIACEKCIIARNKNPGI